ncbi:hypothetical protein FKP32DRAFT_1579484, partial [Trametes sanguinea]
MIENRSLRNERLRIPDDARMVQEGEVVRLLGAWIGNAADPMTAWRPIIEVIKRNLARWGLRNPTMYARKLVVGLEVGSRTQFLTVAQGMPKQAVRELEKVISDFMWQNKGRPMVNKQTLYMPVSKGGL